MVAFFEPVEWLKPQGRQHGQRDLDLIYKVERDLFNYTLSSLGFHMLNK